MTVTPWRSRRLGPLGVGPVGLEVDAVARRVGRPLAADVRRRRDDDHARDRARREQPVGDVQAERGLARRGRRGGEERPAPSDSRKAATAACCQARSGRSAGHAGRRRERWWERTSVPSGRGSLARRPDGKPSFPTPMDLLLKLLADASLSVDAAEAAIAEGAVLTATRGARRRGRGAGRTADCLAADVARRTRGGRATCRRDPRAPGRRARRGCRA